MPQLQRRKNILNLIAFLGHNIDCNLNHIPTFCYIQKHLDEFITWNKNTFHLAISHKLFSRGAFLTPQINSDSDKYFLFWIQSQCFDLKSQRNFIFSYLQSRV